MLIRILQLLKFHMISFMNSFKIVQTIQVQCIHPNSVKHHNVIF